MKTRASMFATSIVVSGLALSLSAAAAPQLAEHLPAAQTQGEVTYISGGIGQTEADAIKHVARYYPLELEFLLKAKSKDEHVAKVRVRIKDEHHKMVLSATSEGPFLLAKLPAGKYTISAERNHEVKNREIQIVANQNRRVVFEWQS